MTGVRVDHYRTKESRWRRWGEDALAWLAIVVAMYGAALLALVTWHALVG